MKRDKELILKLLRYVRSNGDNRTDMQVPDCSNVDPDVVRYHMELCIDAGFVNAVTQDTHQSGLKILGVRSLTWAGHEYLDANCEC